MTCFQDGRPNRFAINREWDIKSRIDTLLNEINISIGYTKMFSVEFFSAMNKNFFHYFNESNFV